jgi:hypothetical protein
MKATTIKVDGELLEALERRKPRDQSLSAFVKSVLRRDLLRRQLADAARRYAEFVAENPEEKSSLDQWHTVDLATKPSPGKRR